MMVLRTGRPKRPTENTSLREKGALESQRSRFEVVKPIKKMEFHITAGAEKKNQSSKTTYKTSLKGRGKGYP